MFGLEALDIGLGLIFVYLLLSLVCTAATELISGILRLRARTLVLGLNNMFRDSQFTKTFLAHPLISRLYRRWNAPAYIPSQTFAATLTSLLAGPGGAQSVRQVKAAVEKLPEGSDLRTAMLVLIDEAQGDIKKVRTNIEDWFNNTMDRVSAWYKARAQTVTFVVALFVAVLMNADTIEITRHLSNDPALRNALVTQAQAYANQESGETAAVTPASVKKIEESVARLEKLGLPLGWKNLPEDWDLGTKALGLLLSTLAISLGAPFWFDVLKKVASLKNVGKEEQTAQK